MARVIPTEQKILGFIKSRSKVGYSELKAEFREIDESTLVRNLNRLVSAGSLEKEKVGRNTHYAIIGIDRVRAFFEKDFFDRPKAAYEPDFLGSYEPNRSSFLGKRYDLLKECLTGSAPLATFDYRSNIRGIENLLVDLSYSSSKLEGNTYTYLDTEVLVKYDESAEGRTQFETQMVLNHKNAIKYVLDNHSYEGFSKTEFFNVHSLLGKGLLADDALGTIRKRSVKIGGSPYVPIDNPFRLEEEFELFVTKLSKIRNPFEQALFILVFVPYLQTFEDINKRTSRITANIPLIREGLPPIGFMRVREREYVDAVLAIYELRDVTLMADLFVKNWIANHDRYA